MRGRKPTPTHLRVVKGNPGKRPLNQAEPKPKGDLFEPPSDLPEKARPFWNAAIADAPAGLLKKLESRVLVIWATAAWLHSDASDKVSKSTLLIKTPTGALVQNPYLSILNRQSTIMMKAAAEMGFTPSSRSRVSVTDAERDADEWGDFG